MVQSAAIECIVVKTSKAILTADIALKFEVTQTGLCEFGLGDRPHSSERALIRERSVVDFDVIQHKHIALKDIFFDVVEQTGTHMFDMKPLNLSAWVRHAVKTIAEKIIGNGDERSFDL